MKNKKKKSKSSEKYYDSKDTDYCVYEVFNNSEKTIYYPRGSQAKHVYQIILDGFKGLPSGLYLNRGGYGFGKKGVFLLSSLKNNFAEKNKLELFITQRRTKSIRKSKDKVVVVLPYQDVKNLLARFGKINEENNKELRETAESFLSTKFSKKIKISTVNFDEYKSGEVAALLRKNKVARKLDEEDMEQLNNLFPKIFESSLKGKKKGLGAKRSSLIKATKKVTDKIFLDEVIKEYEINLSKKTLSEKVWQDFLREKVFRFLSNYVTTIEKQNVSIDVSYPDFVLADVYGFVDVFEIKRHDTPLLAYDDSHENYYWKPELTMAISQIENYIDNIIRNSDEYIRVIKQKKNIDIRVVRPRGYIIAGTSKQFKTKKEQEDFRKLGLALKNIDFVLYDELLKNLKNLRSKL